MSVHSTSFKSNQGCLTLKKQKKFISVKPKSIVLHAQYFNYFIMIIYVFNIFTYLLSYRNHVINFVITNPFSIPGFDNVQNICCGSKRNKYYLNSMLMCEYCFPRVVVTVVRNLVLFSMKIILHVRCHCSKHPISNIKLHVEHRNQAGVPTQLHNPKKSWNQMQCSGITNKCVNFSCCRRRTEALLQVVLGY
jgi:hypothetical protein